MLLHCVAVCCNVLQCVAETRSVKTQVNQQCVAVCRSVLQCVAVCCSVLQHHDSCCSVLQCCCPSYQCVAVFHVAVCCVVLQRVAACCSVLQYVALIEHAINMFKTRMGWL